MVLCETPRYLLLQKRSKEDAIDAAVEVTSIGMATIPKAVHDALGIREGDDVIFRVEDGRAVLSRHQTSLAWQGQSRCPRRSETTHGTM
ncbi:AbrB/MazE/SpoVT family DNA-binding domain-containing protein [Mycobacterium heckeshornense]|uniref:AbrB/MazE/SpoVT family DNA-binding domain-containing protein n=1 Tax=Mycobacterium heckeshornense TaxID=110505 RepID=UPI0008FCE4B6|nr:AbrB/MazE/SpoVT family DNA-binding domain-containing protein [Mycobacterium heckeshornense]